MKKIVLLSKIADNCQSLQQRIKQNIIMVDMTKLLVTLIIFVATLWVYWYFVNVSSTKWYFLRKEMRKLETAKFEHSIIQLKIVKKEKEIWDSIDTDFDPDYYNNKVNPKIVFLQYSSDNNSGNIAKN